MREGERCGLGEGGVGGTGGSLGWINTVDTKGLGSRDLLFSSTLPSISLNPRPSPPNFPPLPLSPVLSRTLRGGGGREIKGRYSRR